MITAYITRFEYLCGADKKHSPAALAEPLFARNASSWLVSAKLR